MDIETGIGDPEGPSRSSLRGSKWQILLKMIKIAIFLLISLLDGHLKSKFAIIILSLGMKEQ